MAKQSGNQKAAGEVIKIVHPISNAPMLEVSNGGRDVRVLGIDGFLAAQFELLEDGTSRYTRRCPNCGDHLVRYSLEGGVPMIEELEFDGTITTPKQPVLLTAPPQASKRSKKSETGGKPPLGL